MRQNADLDQGPVGKMTPKVILKKGSIFPFFCNIPYFFIQEGTAPVNQYWKVKPNVLWKMMRNSASDPEPDGFENMGQIGPVNLFGFVRLCVEHMLNMSQISKVYLGSCVQLYSLAETPQLPPSPRIWAHIRGRYCSDKIDDNSL